MKMKRQSRRVQSALQPLPEPQQRGLHIPVIRVEDKAQQLGIGSHQHLQMLLGKVGLLSAVCRDHQSETTRWGGGRRAFRQDLRK